MTLTALGVECLLALLLLALSAAFSMAETSLMSLSRIQLKRLTKAHPGRLEFWQRDPDRALAVLLLMNNLSNAGLGVLAVSMALAASEGLGFPFVWGSVLFPLAAAGFMIVLGEIAPKVAARLHTERLALAFAPGIRFLTGVFGPLMEGLLRWTGTLLSWLSKTIKTERAQWDAAVIRALLEGAPAAHPVRHLLTNLIGFGSLPVSAVMAPREEVLAVDMSVGPERLRERVLAGGYSRVPVFRGSLDNVEGMVYAKDFLVHWRSEALIVLEDLVRPILRVAPETPLAQLLRVFREGRHHLALVTDKAGRVAGLVTLQDILESIVGDIAEEPAVEPTA